MADMTAARILQGLYPLAQPTGENAFLISGDGAASNPARPVYLVLGIAAYTSFSLILASGALFFQAIALEGLAPSFINRMMILFQAANIAIGALGLALWCLPFYVARHHEGDYNKFKEAHSRIAPCLAGLAMMEKTATLVSAALWMILLTWNLINEFSAMNVINLGAVAVYITTVLFGVVSLALFRDHLPPTAEEEAAQVDVAAADPAAADPDAADPAASAGAAADSAPAPGNAPA